MEYLIAKTVLSSPGSLEIDEAEYELIKGARENLFESLFLEEKLDLVTENYNEYETELLSIASHMMIFNDLDYFSMNHDRNLVSRRIVNLLTACRMYLDQCILHIENIYGKDSIYCNQIRGEISNQYDQTLGYRAMEALRNHVQHRGIPIHKVTFSHEMVGDVGNALILNRVIPMISISALKDDDKFKKKVLNELNSIQSSDWIDVRPLIREYIEGIGKIHEKIREILHSDLFEWEKIIDDVGKKYLSEFIEDSSLLGLAIIAVKDNGEWGETKTIFKDYIERRKALEHKNFLFTNLHNRYVSNEIRKKDSR